MQLFFSFLPIRNIKDKIISGMYIKELIEALCICWTHQLLRGRKNGDVGYTRLAFSLLITLQAFLHLHLEIIADDFSAILASQADQFGTVFHCRIGIINDDGASALKRLLNQLELSLSFVVTQQIFAHISMCCGKVHLVEGTLPG